MLTGLLHKTDGTTVEVTPKNGTDFKLEELYELLNCDTIEVIYLNNNAYHKGSPNSDIFIGDEEARLKSGCKLNEEATNIYRKSWNVGFEYDIVGNILQVKSKGLK